MSHCQVAYTGEMFCEFCGLRYMDQPRSRSCMKYLLIRLQNAGLRAKTQITLSGWGSFFLTLLLSEFEFAFFLKVVFKCFQWSIYLCYPFGLTKIYGISVLLFRLTGNWLVPRTICEFSTFLLTMKCSVLSFYIK